MTGFFLTDKHIKDRTLSAQDFSDFAGFPVYAFYLSDFPHWGKVSKDEALSRWQKYQRYFSMHHAINKADHKERGFWRAPLSNKGIYKNVTFNGAKVSSKITRVPIPSENYYFFNLLKEHDIDTTVDQIHFDIFSKPFSGPQPFTVSGFLCEHVPIRRAYKKHVAYILRRHPDDDISAYWSRLTSILKDRLLPDLPGDGMHILSDDLHEMYHLIQISLIPENDSDGLLLEYYDELGSNLFAFSKSRQAGVGKLTCLANLHANYIASFFSPPSYWIAPALHAIIAGKPIPDFYSVFAATTEIRFRIFMKEMDLEQSVSKTNWLNFAKDIYARPEQMRPYTKELKKSLDVIIAWLYWNPEVLFTHLRHLVEAKVFDSQLAHSIAQKILEAAEYFGGKDLTHAPNVRQKIKFAEPSGAA